MDDKQLALIETDLLDRLLHRCISHRLETAVDVYGELQGMIDELSIKVEKKA